MILSVFIFVWLVLGSGLDKVLDKVVKGLAGHGSMELLFLRRILWLKFMGGFGCLTGANGGKGDWKEELCFLCLLMLDLGFISFSPGFRFCRRGLRAVRATAHRERTNRQLVV